MPTGHTFESAGMDFALGFWVWSFLAAPEPIPEQLIENKAAVLVNHLLDDWGENPREFPPELRSTYVEKFSDPETVHAICEQYRAAATLDFDHDQADRGSHKIACPVLALWSATGPIAAWYEVLDVWREWASDVQGRSIDAGHFLPEEAPQEVAKELAAFFRGADFR